MKLDLCVEDGCYENIGYGDTKRQIIELLRAKVDDPAAVWRTQYDPILNESKFHIGEQRFVLHGDFRKLVTE